MGPTTGCPIRADVEEQRADASIGYPYQAPCGHGIAVDGDSEGAEHEAYSSI
jgi:hypothetical protein